MAVEGLEDQFRPPSLSGWCRLGEATFAGMGGKEEDAPITAVGPVSSRFIDQRQPKLPFEASGKFERSAILVLARYEVFFLLYPRRRSTDHAPQHLAQATPRTSCEAKALWRSDDSAGVACRGFP
jgi:hypothetical protein